MADYPIVYLRGYAGNQGGVEATVDDPFYGFNVGSTHVRVDHDGRPEFFAFSSPVVRLMRDHGYRDVYTRGRQPSPQMPGEQPPPPASLWIFRYYDPTSETFGQRDTQRLEIEQAADRLRRLIGDIKGLTGAPKVILVGHSTGGLIARCLLQKSYPEHDEAAVDHVDKLFTYGTPHGGIAFDVPGGGLLTGVRDALAINNMDDFGPARMQTYLTPTGTQRRDNFDPRGLGGAFPPERVFCLVGTNNDDYEAALGLSRTLVGPQSDGLVQIRNAYVTGAPRAYVHRSHSGRYGMVNSEEGYQNLRRFLFGDLRVELALDGLSRLRDTPADSGVTHQAEVQVAIRQLPILVHDQQLAHHSPVLLELEKAKPDQPPISLFTAFLLTDQAPDREKQICRYALRLAVFSERRREGRLLFRDHLEQIPLWTDHLLVDLRQTAPGAYAGRYGWRSELPGVDPQPNEDLAWTTTEGVSTVAIEMPETARRVLGDDSQVVMHASSWS